MISFKISRIETKHGTFRLTGQWCKESYNINDLNVSLLEIMSTDGWCELALTSSSSIQLLSNIKQQLLEHLILTNKF
jgi:hypothetical protein